MSRNEEYGGSIKDYNVGEQLGCGGFATVYLAHHCNTGHPVAIKKIDKRLIQARGLIERVRQEVEIHAQLSHTSILRLYTFFEDQEYVYLVLELCLNGELQKALRSRGTVLSEDEAREYLSQIVDGMLYLHSKSIIHRDLTLSNILLDDSGRLKIADFGLATRLLRPDDRHTTMCGTPNYISPEVVTRNPHGLESDVWSLGCMLYVMLVGRPPFDSHGVKETILSKVVSANYEEPSYASAEARALIAACLQKDPKNRIRLVDVPHHPFMTGQRIGELSDSGLYTMTTQATTHHHKTSLSVISEAGSVVEDIHDKRLTRTRKEPFLRHPPSPPVRMKSSPRDLPPPHVGVIDTLKRKFTPLPSRQEDFALTAPSLPRFSKRERDVSEERRKNIQQEKESESRRQHQKRGTSQGHHRPQYQQQERENVRPSTSYSSSCSSLCSSHSGCRAGSGDNDYKSYGHQEHLAPILRQSSRSREAVNYSDHIDHEQKFGEHRARTKEGTFERQREHRSRSYDRIRTHSYQEEDRSRERIEPHRSYKDSRSVERLAERTTHSNPSHSMERSNRRRSRSLDIHQHQNRDGTREHRTLERDYREKHTERHRTYSCCQSSQYHRSWCSRKDRQTSDEYRHKNRQNISDKHSDSERRQCGASDNPRSGHHRHISGGSQVSTRSHNSREDKQGNILHDIPQPVNPASVERSRDILYDIPRSDTHIKDGRHGNILSDIPRFLNTPIKDAPVLEASTTKEIIVPQKSIAPRTPPKQIPNPQSRKGLSQQVSPISSCRLRKVRYRTKRYLLNILDGGEVCLEQLRNGRQQMVEEVCWISPDGRTVFIYRPNGGTGCEPGDTPLPRPERECLHFSYDTLPHKYWKKYKDAARFVKLVKSRTTKITYYTDQAKFYLMENAPDPDFVGVFYQGPKMTKTGSKVDVKKTKGSNCTLIFNATNPTHVPGDLRSCYSHFTQAYNHCLHLDQVLSEACIKIGIVCFPAVLGSKPASTTTTTTISLSTPTVTTTQSRKPRQDKENVSPTSSGSSFRSPRNIMSQLGWCEESIASGMVSGLQKSSPPPLVRHPLGPHQPPNISQPKITQPLMPPKKPPDPITIQNIKTDVDYVEVVYSDGSRLWLSSADPPSGELKYSSSQDKEPTLYAGECLPIEVKHKVILYGQHLSQQHQQRQQSSTISHSSKPR